LFDIIRFRFLFHSALRPALQLCARNKAARRYFVDALTFLKDAANAHGGLKSSVVMRSSERTTLKLNHLDGHETDFVA